MRSLSEVAPLNIASMIGLVDPLSLGNMGRGEAPVFKQDATRTWLEGENMQTLAPQLLAALQEQGVSPEQTFNLLLDSTSGERSGQSDGVMAGSARQLLGLMSEEQLSAFLQSATQYEGYTPAELANYANTPEEREALASLADAYGLADVNEALDNVRAAEAAAAAESQAEDVAMEAPAEEPAAEEAPAVEETPEPVSEIDITASAPEDVAAEEVAPAPEAETAPPAAEAAPEVAEPAPEVVAPAPETPEPAPEVSAAPDSAAGSGDATAATVRAEEEPAIKDTITVKASRPDTMREALANARTSARDADREWNSARSDMSESESSRLSYELDARESAMYLDILEERLEPDSRGRVELPNGDKIPLEELLSRSFDDPAVRAISDEVYTRFDAAKETDPQLQTLLAREAEIDAEQAARADAARAEDAAREAEAEAARQAEQ